jgi:hypothetical protein
MRARLFLAHLAGWGLLGLLLLLLLLRVGRRRLLLGGGKADAGRKRQRERAGAQESIWHGGLLFVRSADAIRPSRLCLGCGGRSADITAGAEVWLRAARHLDRSFPRRFRGWR